MTTLGYVGVPIKEADDVDPYQTKLGGRPVWLLRRGPDSERLSCGICGSPMALMMQAYAPLFTMPDHHRVLHVFACLEGDGCASTSRGWAVLRSQMYIPPLKVQRAVLDNTVHGDTKGFSWAAPATGGDGGGGTGATATTTTTSASAALGAGLFSGGFGSLAGGDQGDGAGPAGDDDDALLLALVSKRDAQRDETVAEAQSMQSAAAQRDADAKRAAAEARARVEWPVLYEVDMEAEDPSFRLQALTIDMDAEPAPPEEDDIDVSDGEQEEGDTEEGLESSRFVSKRRIRELIRAYEEEEAAVGGDAHESGNEEYETVVDGTFRYYSRRVAWSPEQILRYSLAPLWMVPFKLSALRERLALERLAPELAASAADAETSAAEQARDITALMDDDSDVDSDQSESKVFSFDPHPEPCANCGAPRVFEFQLLNAALNFASVRPQDADDSPPLPIDPCALMEWGTVMFYCCSQSCEPPLRGDHYLSEFVVVQQGY